MATPVPNQINYWQNRFAEAYSSAEADHKKRANEARARRWAAYVLKAIAIFGAIAVAAGLTGLWAHIVGILIMVAVGIDTLFSNQRRLLLVTRAANAYNRLLESIRHKYDHRLGPILQIVGSEPQRAEQELAAMISAMNDTLFKKRREIEKAIDEEDLKLLTTLAVEKKE